MDSRELRARAAQACVDQYSGKALQFGVRDCVKLVRTSMHKQKVSTQILKGRQYRSLHGGLRVMEALGFESLVEALDAVDELHRIAPASMWPGDIIAHQAPPDDPFGAALGVYVGNRKVIGFTEEGRAAIGRPDLKQALGAWRVVHG